jgi:hypothetical protein
MVALIFLSVIALEGGEPALERRAAVRRQWQ